ncbi:MAG: methyltransferase domain-containing protein [Cyclobacteriaceae bacterium]
MNLKDRSYEEEIMDDLEISGEVVPQTLRELDYINRKLGGNEISLTAFKRILKTHRVNSLVDLGCGGADIVKQMAKIARKQSAKVQFTALDANPHIIKYAASNTSDWPNIQSKCVNIFDESFQKEQYDIIHCCLFLHHFTHGQLVKLFRQFAQQARVAIIVNDLQRHTLAYYSIKWLTRLFSKSYMVRNDAAISVARGFTKRELVSILKEAGISNYTLRWRWAFRWELVVLIENGEWIIDNGG